MHFFELLADDNKARAGSIFTLHGRIQTPSFVSVGTQGAVKALSADDLEEIGVQVIISNTYHLYLHPGSDVIEKTGGLHSFMGWTGPLMTDSGGFQIFSLGAGKEQGVGKIASIFPAEKDRGGHLKKRSTKSLVKVDDDGVEFVSYLDGSIHRLNPEKVVDIQLGFGSDIALPLDECTSPLHGYEYTRKAMQRTHAWISRAACHFRGRPGKGQKLLGIIQGGAYRDLREESSEFVSSMDFDGYAIGGSLGASKEEMYRVLEWTLPLLPRGKPRHLLGIGEIEDVFNAVERGIDTFDCVLPTRLARTGTLFSKEGARYRIHILNNRFRYDTAPISKGCGCYTCRKYSRAYLRHLFSAGEPSAMRLASIHNLFFLESLMAQVRSAISQGKFYQLKREWLG